MAKTIEGYYLNFHPLLYLNISNEIVLERAETQRSLINMIAKPQMYFFGHISRERKLEYLLSTGKFEGKRARDRQRLCC